MKYTLDAQGKKLGRIASEAASILLGKKSTSFAKNTVAQVKVEIINANSTDISAKKRDSDKYVTYTGHRGGLESETLGELIRRAGIKEAYLRAIRRMIPDNKLRDPRMKNLTIKN
jgi:large subunit ribosomal protein L13